MFIGFMKEEDGTILDRDRNVVKSFDDDSGAKHDVDDAVVSCQQGWDWKGESLFRRGAGKLLLTDRRAIYLRDARHSMKMHGLGWVFWGVIVYRDIKAWKIAKEGLWEYFEFNMDAIRKVEFFKKGMFLYLETDGGEKVKVRLRRKKVDWREVWSGMIERDRRLGKVEVMHS